ncbi:hypothetical protein LZ32DRAFT_295386 [Colletotrichum eremochloae]|nr:hypothetical protein LZ32DRAFT_295386 [Colletotrichum eremochloae]
MAERGREHGELGGGQGHLASGDSSGAWALVDGFMSPLYCISRRSAPPPCPLGRSQALEIWSGCWERGEGEGYETGMPSIHCPLSDRTIAAGGAGRSRPFPAFTLFPLWASPAALSWGFWQLRHPWELLSWGNGKKSLLVAHTKEGKDYIAHRLLRTVYGIHGLSTGRILETLEMSECMFGEIGREDLWRRESVQLRSTAGSGRRERTFFPH